LSLSKNHVLGGGERWKRASWTIFPEEGGARETGGGEGKKTEWWTHERSNGKEGGAWVGHEKKPHTKSPAPEKLSKKRGRDSSLGPTKKRKGRDISKDLIRPQEKKKEMDNQKVYVRTTVKYGKRRKERHRGHSHMCSVGGHKKG